MGRVFRRGELKQAIVHVLAVIGDAHGYAIMGELEKRVGGGWKPSPGAIYPALVALVETGHLETCDRDGTQVYALTESGRRLADDSEWARRWSSLSVRAEESEHRVAVGSLLDRFAAGSKVRRRLAGPEQQKTIESVLAKVHGEIEELLEGGDGDGDG